MRFIQRPLKELLRLRRRPPIRNILNWWHRNNLNHLAVRFGTDKWASHWYTQHYQRYFAPLKNRRLNILEIGVGGYDDTAIGGQSLRMWKAFFRNSRIVGIDICDKTQFRENRIDIRVCDQTDADSLNRLVDEYGGFDIIIDDGSHLNEHVITTFLLLFERLRPGGIYVVEDTQTAYWPTWGGGIDNPRNSVAFFKSLIDGLNHAEYPIANYSPSYFDENIVEMAFLHNLIFIRKGSNNEKSNVPREIEKELLALANKKADELKVGGNANSR